MPSRGQITGSGAPGEIIRCTHASPELSFVRTSSRLHLDLKQKYPFRVLSFQTGAPGEIRTPDTWFRRPVLYPAELRALTIYILTD